MAQAKGTTINKKSSKKDVDKTWFNTPISELIKEALSKQPKGSEKQDILALLDVASDNKDVSKQHTQLANALKNAGVKDLAGNKIVNNSRPNMDVLKDAGLLSTDDIITTLLKGETPKAPLPKAGDSASLEKKRTELEQKIKDAAAVGVDAVNEKAELDALDTLDTQSNDINVVDRAQTNTSSDDPYGLLEMYGHTPSADELLDMLNNASASKKDMATTANNRTTTQYYDFLAGLGDTLQSTLGLQDTNAIKAGISKGSQDAMKLAQTLGVAQEGAQGALEFAQMGNDILQQYALEESMNPLTANEMAMGYKDSMLTNHRNMYGSDSVYNATIDSANIAANANKEAAAIAASAPQYTAEPGIFEKYLMEHPELLDGAVRSSYGLPEAAPPPTTAEVNQIINDIYSSSSNTNQPHERSRYR